MTSDDWEIVEIEPRLADQAMHFLAGGGLDSKIVRTRARSLAMFCDDPHMRSWRYWARNGGQCVGMAVVVERPGLTGLLMTPPPHGPCVRPAAQAHAMRRAASASLQAGLSLVQYFVAPQEHESIELAQGAGLELLAELVYLRLDCPQQPAPEPPIAGLTWLGQGQFTQRDLEQLIQRTYVHSLDCPALTGVRRMEDVIASHKVSGYYSPQWWQIALLDGQPAGCMLLNASAIEPGTAEVVYVGVADGFRGRGLGQALLRRAFLQAWDAGMHAVTLAVDGRNHYARRVYDLEGFVATDRKLTYAALRGRTFQTG